MGNRAPLSSWGVGWWEHFNCYQLLEDGRNKKKREEKCKEKSHFHFTLSLERLGARPCRSLNTDNKIEISFFSSKFCLPSFLMLLCLGKCKEMCPLGLGRRGRGGCFLLPTAFPAGTAASFEQFSRKMYSSQSIKTINEKCIKNVWSTFLDK